MPTKPNKFYPYLLLMVLLLSFFMDVKAQQSLDISYSFGSILEHSPRIKPIAKNPVDAFAITYTTKNKTGEHWKKYYNFADYGFTYKYKTFNNPDIIGDAHALTTFLQFSFLKRRKVFDLGFKGHIGVAYLTRIYDEESNPLNNAISTHLNIAAETQIYTRIRLQPVFFEYSLGLNHFSNGIVKAPNLGINTLNNQFAIGVEFEKPKDANTVSAPAKEPYHKNEYWIFAAMGTKSVKDFDERFTFSVVSVNYSRQISMINKIGFGIDFIKDESANQYAIQNLEYKATEDLSFRYGPNIQTEFLFGRTSFTAAYGFYFGDDTYYSKRAYYKVGTKVHFNNFFATALIRAMPLFKAEALLFGLGYRIKSKKQSAH